MQRWKKNEFVEGDGGLLFVKNNKHTVWINKKAPSAVSIITLKSNFVVEVPYDLLWPVLRTTLVPFLYIMTVLVAATSSRNDKAFALIFVFVSWPRPSGCSPSWAGLLKSSWKEELGTSTIHLVPCLDRKYLRTNFCDIFWCWTESSQNDFGRLPGYCVSISSGKVKVQGAAISTRNTFMLQGVYHEGGGEWLPPPPSIRQDRHTW